MTQFKGYLRPTESSGFLERLPKSIRRRRFLLEHSEHRFDLLNCTRHYRRNERRRSDFEKDGIMR